MKVEDIRGKIEDMFNGFLPNELVVIVSSLLFFGLSAKTLVYLFVVFFLWAVIIKIKEVRRLQ